ncbi:hypothetical protein PVAP13_5NG388662 [Panicum virgatum]|uniref:Ubiquitin-like protease family profile domain-containing protein n=1 Tax=Panicum virgatum TaxID=38727 RepID=A0A8T0RUM9_PANVG|nr:hypothetical protein PVAP13_5NG388662 [Panicum virgatum]
MDKGQLATEDELYSIICRHTRHEEGTIFFESKEITLTAHEVAAGMVMGRSLGTNAMHLGTYVLSQDPRKKRTKIMSPWVSIQMMTRPMNSNIVKNAFEFRDSNYEMILFPVHQENIVQPGGDGHWFAFAVNIPDKKFQIIDSLRNSDNARF